MTVTVNTKVSGGAGLVQTVDSGNNSTQNTTLPGAGAIEIGNNTTTTLTLAADSSTEVAISKANQLQYFGVGNITSPAHLVGSFNYVYTDATGKIIALAIGSENSLGLNNGTITRGNSSLHTINSMASGTTITTWTGATASPTNVSSGATITRGEGYRYEVLPSTMLGTIGTSVGFYVADSSAVTGAAVRQGFVNDDSGAVNKAKSPWIDNSFSALAPTNGGTTTIPAGVGLVVLNSGSTIASATLALPTTITDGQRITFFNVNQITSVTFTSAGITPLGLPSTLAVNSFFTIQYAASGPYYVRVA